MNTGIIGPIFLNLIILLILFWVIFVPYKMYQMGIVSKKEIFLGMFFNISMVLITIYNTIMLFFPQTFNLVIYVANFFGLGPLGNAAGFVLVMFYVLVFAFIFGFLTTVELRKHVHKTKKSENKNPLNKQIGSKVLIDTDNLATNSNEQNSPNLA